MTDKEMIGRRIMLARTRAGLTQEKLGAILGISKQAISGWEHGVHEPDAKSIVIMCKVLKVSADELFGLVSLAKTEEKLPDTASNGQSDTKNEAILMNDDTSSIISRDEIEKELLLMACKAIELRESGTLDDLVALVNGTADKICQITSL